MARVLIKFEVAMVVCLLVMHVEATDPPIEFPTLAEECPVPAFNASEACWIDYKVIEAVYQINVCQNCTINGFKVWSGTQEVTAPYRRSIRVLVEYSLPNNESIAEINLESKNIINIDLNAFANVKNVQIVSLSYNYLEEIFPGTFDHLKDLKRLNLNNNRLTRIAKNLFNQNVKLERLSFIRNPIKNVDKSSFAKLQKLKELHIGNEYDGFHRQQNSGAKRKFIWEKY